MAARPLSGLGVLVTRPADQSEELVAAIEAAGGTAIRFPTLEIVPLPASDIDKAAARLRPADIAVFVSPNAVRYGLDYAGTSAVAAVGPATAKALADGERPADIVPDAGYDSEHLLAEARLQDVEGLVVRIIRGTAGRELIARTLRSRGATVEYLAVYERRIPVVGAPAMDRLEQAWLSGTVNVVIVMSVESLRNLITLLPESCRTRLSGVRLVTPAARVIKEALDLVPGIHATLADGPATDNMLRAIAALAAGRS